MELVLASLHLSWMGGATTYLLTVASALQHLGHEVTVYSPDPGAGGSLARAQGLRVNARERDLPRRCDAVLVQDTVMALELGDRLRAPQVFVSHGAEAALAAPPQASGRTAAMVAMNDRVARRARALALDVEVVRLTQPIDTERFWSRGPLRDPPRHVVLLGNYLTGERRAIVTDSCEALGLSWRQVGREGQMSTDVSDAIAEADIVVGYGRSVLEAMASGRAAYVYDYLGGDGWVTPATYPELESAGFTGGTTDAVRCREDVRAGLAAYDADMGVANRELILSHHGAGAHAIALVELFERVADGPRARPVGARELARVVRAQWHADWRMQELWRELERERAARVAEEQRARAAEERADDAERRLREVATSWRWRAVQRLLGPLDRARGR